MKKILIYFLLIFFTFYHAQEKIPILGFMGVPENSVSVENYKKMHDSGFNISLMDFTNFNSAIYALDCAEKANMKLILIFPTLLTQKTDIDKIKNHKSLIGYYIADEPSLDEFDFYEKRIEQIKRNDNSKFFYINLHPNYAPLVNLKANSYDEYITKFASTSSVQAISFDNYPVVGNKIRNDWYQNLESIRRVSLQYHKVFWAFACSTIHDEYLKPTLSGIRLQQFGNLLYGAQGLQYFRYWGHHENEIRMSKNIGYSVVDDRGNPTPTYDVVKTVNEQIQRLAWVFSGAKSDAVFHSGNELPEGTVKLYSIPKQFKSLSTYGKNAIVSLMSNGKNRFIIVQNKSLNETLNLEYRLQNALKKINNNTGKTEQLSVSKKYIDTILPGDILIFTYTR